MNMAQFLDEVGEFIIMVWSDEFESRDWVLVPNLKESLKKRVFDLAGFLFDVSNALHSNVMLEV